MLVLPPSPSKKQATVTFRLGLQWQTRMLLQEVLLDMQALSKVSVCGLIEEQGGALQLVVVVWRGRERPEGTFAVHSSLVCAAV